MTSKVFFMGLPLLATKAVSLGLCFTRYVVDRESLTKSSEDPQSFEKISD